MFMSLHSLLIILVETFVILESLDGGENGGAYHDEEALFQCFRYCQLKYCQEGKVVAFNIAGAAVHSIKGRKIPISNVG